MNLWWRSLGTGQLQNKVRHSGSPYSILKINHVLNLCLRAQNKMILLFGISQSTHWQIFSLQLSSPNNNNKKGRRILESSKSEKHRAKIHCRTFNMLMYIMILEKVKWVNINICKNSEKAWHIYMRSTDVTRRGNNRKNPVSRPRLPWLGS